MTNTNLLTPDDLQLPKKFNRFWPNQENLIIDLACSQKRHSIISAPTGSGKSLIYIALAQYLGGRTLVVTPTRGLQQQLLTDFESIGLVDIRGRNNYQCGKYGNCEIGRVNECHLRTTVDCDYFATKVKASKANLVITNNAYWMGITRAEPDCLGKFDRIIFDEAHTAAPLLSSFCSFTLVNDYIWNELNVETPSSLDLATWQLWAREARSRAQSEYQSRLDSGMPQTALEDLLELRHNLGLICNYNCWIIEKSKSALTGYNFQPIWANSFSEEILFRDIPRVLFFSATIKERDARYLGLGEDYDYYELESFFDAKKAPLIYIPTTRVDSKMSSAQVNTLINKADSIIKNRLDRKGIIQTISYRSASYVRDRSRYTQYMLFHDSKNRERIIEQYILSDEPVILVSPSVEEGYDFKDDLCRYQILLKVPLMDNRPKIMKERIKQDKRYSLYMTMLRLQQIAGRARRNAQDWCELFLLDDHWLWFCKNKDLANKWFVDTWTRKSSIPEPPKLD